MYKSVEKKNISEAFSNKSSFAITLNVKYEDYIKFILCVCVYLFVHTCTWTFLHC